MVLTNQICRIPGGISGSHGEVSNFIRHHCKSGSGLAGPGGLNRRIERQQI
jgi:hypothetical protein